MALFHDNNNKFNTGILGGFTNNPCSEQPLPPYFDVDAPAKDRYLGAFHDSANCVIDLTELTNGSIRLRIVDKTSGFGGPQSVTIPKAAVNQLAEELTYHVKYGETF